MWSLGTQKRTAHSTAQRGGPEGEEKTCDPGSQDEGEEKMCDPGSQDEESQDGLDPGTARKGGPCRSPLPLWEREAGVCGMAVTEKRLCLGRRQNFKGFIAIASTVNVTIFRNKIFLCSVHTALHALSKHDK